MSVLVAILAFAIVAYTIGIAVGVAIGWTIWGRVK